MFQDEEYGILDKEIILSKKRTIKSSLYCSVIFIILFLHKLIIAFTFPLYFENLFIGLPLSIHFEQFFLEGSIQGFLIFIVFFITRREKPLISWLKIPVVSTLLGLGMMAFLFFNNWEPQELSWINLHVDFGPKLNFYAYLSHGFLNGVRIGCFISLGLLLLLRILPNKFKKNEFT